MSPAEIRAALAQGPVRVMGRGSHDLWAYAGLCPSVVTVEGGLVAYSPDDQFITIGAGMLVSELRAILAERGQMIPLLEPMLLGERSLEEGVSPSPREGEVREQSERGGGKSRAKTQRTQRPPSPSLHAGTPPCKQGGEFSGTIGGLLSMAFPHPAEATYFDWRTWVLGMTIMLPDGRIVKSGSTVVKSVAGFDVFKLMVGARGTLGIILEVTLRTMGRRALSQTIQLGPQTVCRWIQRVLPSDFEAHQRAHLEQLVASDPATATLWANEHPPRLPGDWVICASPEPGFRHRANEPEQWLRQLKAQLDPENKLNPGGMGDLF